MAEHVLMEKGPATMNVPPDKVNEYEKDGWVVIPRPPEPPAPVAAESVEPGTEVPTFEDVSKKSSRKKSSEI